MKGGLRQSMAWLHGWSGLLLGWLLYTIFLTGTLSFFRQEITTWMQPELHTAASSSPNALANALDKLEAIAPDAESWTVALPSSRANGMRISWRESEPRDAASPRAADPEKQKRSTANANRRRAPPGILLDPATGAVLEPRATAGGEFLYHLHFELYALPRAWARWIVGIATMAMFVGLISGVITHKKIFRDFFTFRPGKGQRSWLDAHNAAAVLSLPFHLVITFSGLILLSATILPWAGQQMFGDDPRAALNLERRLAEERYDKMRDDLARKNPQGQVPIEAILERARAEWEQPVGRITIARPQRPGSTIELTPRRNDSLLLRAGGGPGRKMLFDAATGELLENDRGAPRSAIQGVERVLVALHLGRFAPPAMRWLYFLAGIGGTTMIGTGLVLWSVKRAERNWAGQLPFGHRLVDHLNVGTIAGLMIALAGYFWANRLLPAQMPGREQSEIYIFFLLWLLAFLHPVVRPLKRAWIEQLLLGGVMFAAIPLVNGLTGHAHLGVAAAAGNWIVAGFDLVCLATGLVLLEIARRLFNRRLSDRASKRRSAAALEPEHHTNFQAVD